MLSESLVQLLQLNYAVSFSSGDELLLLFNNLSEETQCEMLDAMKNEIIKQITNNFRTQDDTESYINDIFNSLKNKNHLYPRNNFSFFPCITPKKTCIYHIPKGLCFFSYLYLYCFFIYFFIFIVF